MRNILSSAAFFAPDTEAGSTPRILPDLSATESKPEAVTEAQPVKPVNSGKRKLNGKRSRKAGKAAKPEAQPEAKPNAPATHEMRGSYLGASPTFRQHGRKLSPIVLNRIPGSFTERDAAFLSDLHGKHGVKPFKRYDADAGNVSRAIGHGYLKHVSGALDSREATFAVTERYIRERKQSVRATPSK